MPSSYVENKVIENSDFKQSVRVATTENINLSGLGTVDGVSLNQGDRILVKNQNSGSQNGIYIASSGSWSRSLDANNSTELSSGLMIYVEEGVSNGRVIWKLTNSGVITLDSTNLVFSNDTGSSKFSVSSGTSVPIIITNDGTGNSFVVNDVTGDSSPFVIDASGNVGIGTSTPSAKLEIQGSSGVYTRLGTTSSSFYVVHNGTTDTFLYTQEASPLRIGTSATERLRITSGGNLEIKSNAGNISTLFTYNENGGELVHYDDAQAAATLLDQCNNSTRLLELINGSDLLLGLGSSNTTGSVRFMRAGFSEIVRINSSGNIGIGSSTNNDNIRTRLQVCGPDADDDPSLGSGTGALLVTNSDSAYGMQFGVSSDGVGWIQQGRVDGTATAYNLLLNPVGGNVGIGVTSPQSKLSVVNGSDNTTTSLALKEAYIVGPNNTLASGAGNLQISTNDSASVDFGGMITFGGRYSTQGDARTIPWGVIKGAKENSTNGSGLGYLVFGTNDNSNIVERMRITSAGSVGIGTSSPQQKFVVSNAGAEGMEIIPALNSNESRIQTYNRSTSAWNKFSINCSTFELFTNGGTTTIFGNTSGNVGIGTTSVSSGFRIDIRGRLLSYTTASDGLITVQGLQTESAGTGKAAIQIDVNGKGGFAWQNDASSGTRALRLLENSGYGAGDTTALLYSGGAFTFNRRVDITQGTTTGAQAHCYVRPENGGLGRDSQITFGCTFSNGWGGGDLAARDAGAIRFGANGGSSDPRDWSMRFLVADGPGGSDTPRECMRINTYGNVGIGVTPPAGTSTTSRLHVATDITLYGASRGFLGNVYFDGAWKYASTGYGWAWVDSGSGNIDFARTSTSGTAGATATFLPAMRINDASEVLIGTTTDQGNFKLQVGGNTYLENLYLSTTTNWGRLAINHAGATTFAAGWNNTDTSSTGQTTLNILRNGVSVGTISTTNAATSFNTTSDYRLKANPRPITNATERIARIKPSQWDWHVGGVGEGFIAHELVDAVPLAVTGEKDAVDATGNPVWQTVDMSKVVPVLVAALQEANARIAALEQRINA